MQSRRKLFIGAVLLIFMILSMVTPALATETEPTTEHVHTWTTSNASRDMHIITCTTCNERKKEPHTLDSEGNCIVCGRPYSHLHSWRRIDADSQYHTITCDGCGVRKTVTHDIRGGVCTVCGYEEHTHIMQYVGGKTYNLNHSTKCMFCSTVGSEEHTYGNDDKCTVCGRERPCEHQWAYSGETSRDWHILSCTCGETMEEPHSWTWNAAGKYVDCTVCGLKDSGHFHRYFYPNGTNCIECGYRKGTAGSENQSNRTESEAGYTKTESVDTKPVETEPADTVAVETEALDIVPVETDSVETAPTETNPTEVTSGEADQAETEKEVLDTFDEEDGKEDSKPDGSALIWVAAIVFIAAGLIIGLLLWKKNLPK